MKKLLSKSALVMLFVLAVLCLPGKAGAQIPFPKPKNCYLVFQFHNSSFDYKSYNMSYTISTVSPTIYSNLGNIDVNPAQMIWDNATSKWVRIWTQTISAQYSIPVSTVKVRVNSLDNNQWREFYIQNPGEMGRVIVIVGIDSDGNLKLSQN